MDNVTIQNAVVDTALDIRELTTAELDGTGVLDTLLKTMRLHLDREFDNDRITGAAYVTTYTQVINTFLAQACNYALAKSKLALELTTQQKQIELLASQKAQVDASTQLIGKQIEQLNFEIAYKQPKELELLERQITLADREIGLKEVQTAQLQYVIDNQLPAEVAQIQAQTDLVITQDDLAEYELATKAPVQTQILEQQREQLIAQTSHIAKQELQTVQQTINIDADTAIKDYQLSQVLPAEVHKTELETQLVEAQTLKLATETGVTIKQGDLVNAQALQTRAETNRINAEVGMKLPIEVANLTKTGLQIVAQSSYIHSQSETLEAERTLKLPAEISLIQGQISKLSKDTQLTEKQLDIAAKEIILKEKEIAVQQSQANLYEQKKVTEVAQTNANVIGSGSVLDHQNQLMQAQTEGFQRDAEQKAAKILVDTWSLRKNTDPEGNPENSINKLEDTNVGKSIQKLLAGVGISI